MNKHAKTYSDNRSKVWKEYEKTIINNGSLRGYGLNKSWSNKRVRIFRKIVLSARKVLIIGELFTVCLYKAYALFQGLLSCLFFADFHASARLGLGKFDDTDYDQELVARFEKAFDKERIFFSHNTLKTFYYLEGILEFLPKRQELSVIEVGAGLFNFGYLLSFHFQALSYTIIDLPGMISKSERIIRDYYGFDGEIFTAENIEEFYTTECKRKILFLEPCQMSLIKGSFDLFVNHESFAEMEIKTVRNYIKELSSHLKQGGILFSVNRLCRVQALNHSDFQNISSFDSITNFSDYDLDLFNPLVVKVDRFRQMLKLQNNNPNVFYIGQKK